MFGLKRLFIVASLLIAFGVGTANSAWHREEWSPTMVGGWEAVASEKGLQPGHTYTADFQVFDKEGDISPSYHRGVSAQVVPSSGRITFRVPSDDLLWTDEAKDGFHKVRAIISECVLITYTDPELQELFGHICVSERNSRGTVPAIHPVSGTRMVHEFYLYDGGGY